MKTNKNITTIITIKEKSNFERCFLSTKKLNCDYLVLDSFNLEDVKLFCEIHKIKYINSKSCAQINNTELMTYCQKNNIKLDLA